MIRERNELDLATTMMLDHGFGDIQEGFGAPGSAVIDAGFTCVLPEPDIDLADIFDVNEITGLTAVAKTVTALKQFWILSGLHLVVQVEGHTGHTALVLFAGAIDVEVLEADDLAVGGRQQATDIFVKQELGVAVDVQRLLEATVFDEIVVTATIGRGRGGVDKRNAARDAEVQQGLGVIVIDLHHELAIPLGGGRAGSLMEDRLDFVPLFKGVASNDAGEKIILVEIVGDIQIDQVGELGAIGQIVDSDNIGVTGLIEKFDEITADKASATSDDNHKLLPRKEPKEKEPGCPSLPRPV